MCRAASPLPIGSVCLDAAAGLLALAAPPCDAQPDAKRQRVESKRAALVSTAPLCATGERWSLVNDGARVSSFGRYQAPGREPRTVRIPGRCAYVSLKGTIIRVDAMVAAAFLPPPPPGIGAHELIHLDGDCHNDRADNLQWVRGGGGTGRLAHSMAVIRKQCPLPVTRDCLLKQLLQQPQVPIAGLDVLAEVWTELPAHSNARGLCPSVSSWGGYRAAGKERAHVWRGGARAVSINGTKIMLDRLVADTFVPKTDALADQLVHLDGDAENCAAHNLAWRLHPSRDPGTARSEVYANASPALAVRAATYYRRKTGAPSPEPKTVADYKDWAAARSLEILAAQGVATRRPSTP